jgi:ATP-dependent DNA ligase
MKAFVTLFRNLEESADHKVRMNQIIDFFRVSTEEEITSAIDFLSGNRPKKLIDISTLKDAIQQMAFLPEWLIEESYSHSGDWAEVVSLLIKPNKKEREQTLFKWLDEVERLRSLDSTMKMEGVFSALQTVSIDERYFLIKVFTGGTRLKIPLELLKQCLDIFSGVPQETVKDTLQEKGTIHKVTVVLLYVKYGRGTNTEYSFAVKKGDGLVTLTKITSEGDADFDMEVSSFVKNNTLEKFGPVISVKPEMVFEIGFDEVRLSPRHKCGVSLVSPKIIALLRGITPEEIGSIEYISSLISN